MTLDAAIGSLAASASAATVDRSRDPGVAASLDAVAGSSAKSVPPVERSKASGDSTTTRDAGSQREREDSDHGDERGPAPVGTVAQYRYTLKFIQGMVRPLVQVVEAETERLVSSYPPEQMARLLENADRLGQPSVSLVPSSKLDASA